MSGRILVEPEAIRARTAKGRCDTALFLTSFHRPPLPTAPVPRLARVPRIGAISTDHPGSPLDLRRVPDPQDVPDTVHIALARPPGREARQPVVCSPEEASWP